MLIQQQRLAKILNVDRRTVYLWTQDGKITAVLDKKHKKKIKGYDLETVLKQLGYSEEVIAFMLKEFEC